MVWTTSTNKNCKRCQIGSQILEAFLKDHSYIKALALDCERTSIDSKEYQDRVNQICSNSELLPHITIFEQKSDDVSKQWPKDHIYSGVVADYSLLEYIDSFMLNYVQVVDTVKLLNRLLQDKKNQHKIILATASDNVPTFYKALSTEFRNQGIQFIMIDRDNKRLVSKFQNLSQENDGLVYFRNNETLSIFEEKVNSTNYEQIVKFVKGFIGVSEPQEEISNPKMMTIELPYTELKRYINKHYDNWLMVQITSKSQQQDLLPAYKDKFEELFRYSHITCKLRECKDFVQDQMGLLEKLPQLIIYSLGRKTLNQFIIVKPEYTHEQLIQLLINHVHPAETILNQYATAADDNENIENFIKKNLNDNKFPLIWFYDSKNIFQKLLMHTFSNNEKYRSSIRFAKVSDPNKETKDQYNLLGKYPEPVAFLDIEDSTYKKATMTIKEKKFSNYVEFVENLHQRKISQKLDKIPINDINKPEEFDKACQLSDKPCIIAILSTYKTGKNKIEMEILESSKNNFSRDYNWAWLDGNCHPEFLKPLFIKQSKLSTVIYYNRNKKRFFVMQDELNQENLDFFLQNLNKKSTVSKMIRLDDEIDLEDTQWKCKRINEELKTKQMEDRKQKLSEKAGQMKQQEDL